MGEQVTLADERPCFDATFALDKTVDTAHLNQRAPLS